MQTKLQLKETPGDASLSQSGSPGTQPSQWCGLPPQTPQSCRMGFASQKNDIVEKTSHSISIHMVSVHSLISFCEFRRQLDTAPLIRSLGMPLGSEDVLESDRLGCATPNSCGKLTYHM